LSASAAEHQDGLDARHKHLDNSASSFEFPARRLRRVVSGSTNAVLLTSPPTAYRRATVTLDGQPLTLISASNQFALTQTGRGRPERIDLALGPLPVDTDGDGLADAWERSISADQRESWRRS
jgi:hypothetical protein